MSADVDEIHDLIAVHAAAYARFGRAATLNDNDEAKAKSRKFAKAIEKKFEAASDAEQDAYRAILAAPPIGVSALRAKVSWVQWQLSMGNRLEEDEVELLLASLMEATP